MDVKIGVKGAPREVELEMDDASKRDELVKQIEGAIGKDGHVLWLTDKRGRTVGVPGGKIAYVELGSASDGRKVGFSSGS